MSWELIAFFLLLVLSLAISTVLFLLLRSSLIDLLRHTLGSTGLPFFILTASNKYRFLTFTRANKATFGLIGWLYITS